MSVSIMPLNLQHLFGGLVGAYLFIKLNKRLFILQNTNQYWSANWLWSKMHEINRKQQLGSLICPQENGREPFTRHLQPSAADYCWSYRWKPPGCHCAVQCSTWVQWYPSILVWNPNLVCRWGCISLSHSRARGFVIKGTELFLKP